MAFHNLLNFLKFFCGLAVERPFLEFDTDIGAGIVAELVGVDGIAAAHNHLHVDQALDALVYCRPRYTALQGYVLGGDPRIVHDYVENLLI